MGTTQQQKDAGSKGFLFVRPLDKMFRHPSGARAALQALQGAGDDPGCRLDAPQPGPGNAHCAGLESV